MIRVIRDGTAIAINIGGQYRRSATRHCRSRLDDSEAMIAKS
jgi:hypothetical protein